MKSHQPEVFGTTLEKTNRWVKEISDLLHWDDHHKAYHGLRAVLHAVYGVPTYSVYNDDVPVAQRVGPALVGYRPKPGDRASMALWDTLAPESDHRSCQDALHILILM